MAMTSQIRIFWARSILFTVCGPKAHTLIYCKKLKCPAFFEEPWSQSRKRTRSEDSVCKWSHESSLRSHQKQYDSNQCLQHLEWKQGIIHGLNLAGKCFFFSLGTRGKKWEPSVLRIVWWQRTLIELKHFHLNGSNLHIQTHYEQLGHHSSLV